MTHREVLNLFGENIQYFRKKQRMSQDQLAERIHVNRARISAVENGKGSLDLSEMLTLAEIFQISFTELFGEECGKSPDR